MDAALLHDAVQAVCPIDGISLGALDDKSTWDIQFSADATEDQKRAALAAVADFDVNTKPPGQVLSQDLMAQFTAEDAAKIRTAVESDPRFWLLWQAMTAQRDPMVVTNDRFLQGWSALVSVLGKDRMTAIAEALGVSVKG